MPANYVQMVSSMPGAARVIAEKPVAPRLSETVLIVEDNLIIAMSAEVIHSGRA